MATLTESSTWEPGVYQLEVTDPVAGGPTGVMNVQARELANRTAWLKEHALVGAVGLGAYAAGDLFYATGAAQLARLPIATAGHVLASDGAAPVWADSLALAGSITAHGARFTADVAIPYDTALLFEGGGSTRAIIAKNGDDETELRLGGKILGLRDTVTTTTAGPLLRYLQGFDFTTNTPFKIPMYAWS